ncbi:hypothetical protein B0T19DRAFT_423029 [Cercophora scortea]|uniref:Uncharacterized protein n=1 Tax=Cercophora scortea TaxID=314031 RepID=A0AAE0IMR0_9PEZI|nr:hypothetical protein B0T19DRAFT_423029 [Cercophora scortea]
MGALAGWRVGVLGLRCLDSGCCFGSHEEMADWDWRQLQQRDLGLQISSGTCPQARRHTMPASSVAAFLAEWRGWVPGGGWRW